MSPAPITPASTTPRQPTVTTASPLAPKPLTLSTPPLDFRIERLLGAAQSFIGVPEAGGPNRGQMVELFLKEVGLPPGQPWCAAFVHHVGYWALFDYIEHRTDWPLPATGSCFSLGDFAQKHGALVTRPERGDVFLLHFPSLGRFAHTGFVLDVVETSGTFSCTTIEGNTNDDGGRDGWKTCLKTRLFPKNAGHAFIRWTALPTHAAAAIRKAA